MIAELNQPVAFTGDITEARSRLADLKMKEADAMREAAEIEKDLAAKEGEIIKVRRQIEQLQHQIYLGVSSGGSVGLGTGINRIAQLNGPGGSRISAPIIVAEQVGTAKKAPGRPKREDIEMAGGSATQESLPTMIEKWLREANKEGLSLADIIQKVRESGYVSLSKKPRSMVDQAIFRLKKKEKIVRNPDNMRFFLTELVDAA
jgi:hypothetical protein